MVHTAKKRFGQHFLKDKHIAERICESLLGEHGYENVLEIGPGLGVLTEYLYPALAEKLYLVEIDTDLLPGLRSRYPLIADHIYENDFLELDLKKLFRSQTAIIGNFPYNISSQILFKIVESREIIPVMVGMFQKEVAQRVAAVPGNKIYGLLSAWVQAFFEIEMLFTVNEGSFSPPPKVKSAVIRLKRKAQEPDCDTHLMLQIIKAAFNQRRKTLRNALSNYKPFFEKIADQTLLNRRAEELGFESYIMLAQIIGGRKQGSGVSLPVGQTGGQGSGVSNPEPLMIEHEAGIQNREGRPVFLVTDLVPPGCIDTLKQLGFEVDHIDDLSNTQLYEIIGKYTGIVVRTSLILDKAMLDAATNLKYILRPGSGLDNVDTAYAEEKGMRIFNSPEANSDAVAEHAIGLLFSLLNYIPRANEEVRKGKWLRKENTGTLLKGKTVAIIGYGHTGSAMARKLRGFEVEILVYDKYKTGFTENGIRETGMEEIFEKADILSLHIPLSAETKYMVNGPYLMRFSKPLYLVNTSRGKIVELSAVADALKTGKVSGAALDVLENEKLSNYEDADQELLDELFRAGNVIVTPHIAGWTRESRDDIFYVVLEKFSRFMKQADSD